MILQVPAIFWRSNQLPGIQEALLRSIVFAISNLWSGSQVGRGMIPMAAIYFVAGNRRCWLGFQPSTKKTCPKKMLGFWFFGEVLGIIKRSVTTWLHVTDIDLEICIMVSHLDFPPSKLSRKKNNRTALTSAFSHLEHDSSRVLNQKVTSPYFASY